MRLHIVSDLHLECLGDAREFVLPAVGADVLVLAGDIHKHTRGLVWAADLGRARGIEVVYVAGNHEPYGAHLYGLMSQMGKVAEELGIHFLEQSTATLGGVKFVGTTLWTDFRLYGETSVVPAMNAAQRSMYDYKLIRTSGGKLLLPEQTVRLHNTARLWLGEELAKLHDGPTVVVTHHAPHPNSVADRFRNSILSAAFASDLTALIERYQPALWVHGHTHDRLDYSVGRTRIVCNPGGYPDESSQGELTFDPGFVITI